MDEENRSSTTFGIPGGTSFLATGTWDTEYPGLVEDQQVGTFPDLDIDELPVNFVYQVYHIMVALFGVIVICLILAAIFGRKKAKRGVWNMKWLQWLLIISPLFPFLAIQTGWLTAEVGRQPYVVYPSTSGPDQVYLPTASGTSVSVQPFEVVLTLALFLLVYLMLFIGWWRVIARFIKEGPVKDAPVEAKVTEVSFKGAVKDEKTGEAVVVAASDESLEEVALSEDEAAPKGGDAR